MTREVRMAAIAAAAVATAGHPDTEVAYDPDGKAIGANSVEIAVRIVAIAQTLETWVLEAPAGLVAQAKAAGAVPHPAEEELERAPVAEGDFNVDECPIHHEARASQYEPELDPLYCTQCEWQRKDWINTDDETGEMKRVRKYRIVKGKGTFMKLDAYMAELRSRGLVT